MSNHKLGPSKTGTTHWWHQRLTAIALIPLVLFLIGLLPSMAGATYREFSALMQIPVTPVVLVLLVGGSTAIRTLRPVVAVRQKLYCT